MPHAPLCAPAQTAPLSVADSIRPARRTATAAAMLLAAAPLALLTACGPKDGGHPGGFPTAEVSVVAVQKQDVPLVFEYTGQTAGSREVEVRARVTGILNKRNYTEGSIVHAGQSLFNIDPLPFQAAAGRAEADLAGAEARFGQAQRNSARLKPLFEARAVSQKEYDDAVSGEQIAAADVKSAKTRLTEARLNLEYTRVEAPITGLSSRALKSEGSLISGPDVLLTTVTQSDPIYVNFGIPDNEQQKLKSDIEQGRVIVPKDGRYDVTVKLADGSAYARTGKLAFADLRVSNATGTADARAELPNPDGALRPGQFVRVLVKGAQRPGAILVPQRAVLEGPQGKFVYVVDAESKAAIKPVQVGDWSGDSWVINSGLDAGDKVIVDGVMKIGPGAPVKIAEPKAPGAAPPGAPAKPGDTKPAGAKPADAKPAPSANDTKK